MERKSSVLKKDISEIISRGARAHKEMPHIPMLNEGSP
jgi:hypothetical protein